MAEWVALRLPSAVGAELALSDIREIVGWNHDYFRSRVSPGNGHGAEPGAAVIVAGAETVDSALSRAEAAGRRYTAEQVHAVLAAQVRYLAERGLTG